MDESVVTSSDMMKFRLLQAYRLWNQGGRKGNIAVVTCVEQIVEKVFGERYDEFDDKLISKLEVYDLFSDAVIPLGVFLGTYVPGDVIEYWGQEGNKVVRNYTAQLERNSYEQIIDDAKKASRLVFGNQKGNGK